MASLTGTKIKDTYDGLLKTTDNGGLGATEKLITDGLGNSSGVYLGTSGNVGIGATPTYQFEVGGVSQPRMAIVSTSATGASQLNFGDNSDGDVGRLRYDHNGDFMAIYTSGSERMRIDSSGNVDINGGGYLRVSPSTPPSIQIYRDVNLGNNASAGSLNFGGVDTSVFASGAAIGATTEGVWSSSSHPTRLYFATTASGSSTATERMRITSGGYLKASNNGSYLGSTSNYHELRQTNSDYIIRMTSAAATPDGIYMAWDNDPNNSSQKIMYVTAGGSSRFYVESSGAVYNSTGTYGTISDIKAKENIVDATPKLDKLMDVRVVNYNLIGDELKQIGVVAQELETIFPAMIDESTDFEEREVELRDENGEIVYETEQVLVSEAIAEELDADGNVITPAQEAVYETVTTDRPVMTTERVDLGTTTKSVKYSVFVPILVKAMQEQQEIINKLEARIAALEAK